MNGNKKTILIIDDDDDIRSVYVEVFKKEGFEVLEAKDGLEGLDLAIKSSPDVIFTGIIMPRMDGFGLKEALSKNVTTSNIPVIMSSHMGREEDRRRAKEMGISDFIIQGMTTPKEVVERIRLNLGESKKKYEIKFNVSELDAPVLAQNFHFDSNFCCHECGTQMNLILEVLDISKHDFRAGFVCPKCQR